MEEESSLEECHSLEQRRMTKVEQRENAQKTIRVLKELEVRILEVVGDIEIEGNIPENLKWAKSHLDLAINRMEREIRTIKDKHQL